MYDSVGLSAMQSNDADAEDGQSVHAGASPPAGFRSAAVPMRPGRAIPAWLDEVEDRAELRLSYDAATAALWQWMAPRERPSFTEGLLHEMTASLDRVERALATAGDGASPVRYLILGSDLPGIFNLGGNLALFEHLIDTGDRERLRHYARVCARGQFRLADHFGGHALCTIALVQGDALGGGFESALAHDVIIAERSARFGLPEVLFNMFPGMGAYSFLSRRLDSARAERMILSGRVYTADELYAEGVVDRVVDDGSGVDAVHDFIAAANRQWNSRRAVARVRDIVRPLDLAELIRIVDLWVEAAFALTAADLRRMRHLAKAQDRRWRALNGGSAGGAAAPARRVAQAAE